jgi:hypothetical protein
LIHNGVEATQWAAGFRSVHVCKFSH